MPRIWSALILFLAGLAPAAVAQTARELVGTWELVSRIQRDSSGRVIPDSSLGAAPIGILVYDATGHVAVQLMKRQRRAASCAVTAKADRNNLAQIGGYDAYFGHYEVNPATHTVTHHLEAAIGPGDVGRALTREFHLQGDTLSLEFRPGGPRDQRVRTLVWHRVSS